MRAQIKVNVAGTTVRFFAHRSDAIAVANTFTKGRDYQHRAKHFGDGWLVLSVRGELHDVDGKLPEATAQLIQSGTPNVENHRETVKILRQLNAEFYSMCFNAGVGSRAHAFIEFNGLMSKYIDLVSMAVEGGMDPQLLNEHNNTPLPVEDHDMEYFGEKLRCMFGPTLDANPAAKAALRKALKL